MADSAFIGSVVARSPCGTEARVVCACCRHVERVDICVDGTPMAGEALRRVVGLALAAWRIAPVEIDGISALAAVCGTCCHEKGIA